MTLPRSLLRCRGRKIKHKRSKSLILKFFRRIFSAEQEKKKKRRSKARRNFLHRWLKTLAWLLESKWIKIVCAFFSRSMELDELFHWCWDWKLWKLWKESTQQSQTQHDDHQKLHLTRFHRVSLLSHEKSLLKGLDAYRIRVWWHDRSWWVGTAGGVEIVHHCEVVFMFFLLELFTTLFWKTFLESCKNFLLTQHPVGRSKII